VDTLIPETPLPQNMSGMKMTIYLDEMIPELEDLLDKYQVSYMIVEGE